MAITGQFYNHTLDDFASGSNIPGDTYKVVLLSASYTFDATDTTYADISAAEVSGGGWTAGGYTLGSVVIETTATNAVKFDAADVSQALSGASLASVKHFAIINSTDSNRLLFLFTSDVTITWPDGTTAAINWPAAGIMVITPA